MRRVLAALLLVAAPAAAQTVPAAQAPTGPGLPFQMPAGSEQRATNVEDYGSLRLPAGPWDGTKVPAVEPEGAVAEIAWQVQDITQGTLALLAPLREQAEAAGFATVYGCETDGCGGFDFRYASPLLAEPGMHIDLGDFRYLLGKRTTAEGDAWLALWVSRSPSHGFVQASLVTPAAAPRPTPADPGPADPTPGATIGSATPDAEGDASAIGAELEEHGSLVLSDLAFATGSAELDPGDYASLTALAAWLAADPGRRVTLVGHSDTEGSAEANRNLSAQRAQSVRRRLTETLGTAAAQVEADGVGYLSPLTTNLTPEGRAKNRRVEVVLTSTR